MLLKSEAKRGAAIKREVARLIRDEHLLIKESPEPILKHVDILAKKRPTTETLRSSLKPTPHTGPRPVYVPAKYPEGHQRSSPRTTSNTPAWTLPAPAGGLVRLPSISSLMSALASADHSPTPPVRESPVACNGLFPFPNCMTMPFGGLAMQFNNYGMSLPGMSPRFFASPNTINLANSYGFQQ